MQVSYETIDLEKLRKDFPVYKKPESYHIDGHMGSVCFGDAPGFPSYFLQAVYTRYGNHPSKGAQYVIFDSERKQYHVVITADSPANYSLKEREKLLKSLYKPLPIEHERVRSWFKLLLTYFHSAFRVTDMETGKEKTHYSSDPALNALFWQSHLAVINIHKIYPDYEVDPAVLVDPSRFEAKDGRWWERCSVSEGANNDRP